MYNINYKYLRKWYLFGGCFLIVGLTILISSIIFKVLESRKMDKLDGEAVAYEIIPNCNTDKKDESIKCSPLYKYRVDGNEYACKTNGSSTSRSYENKNKVFYNTSNPSECLNEYELELYNFFIIFYLLSTIFILIGLTGIIFVAKKINKLKLLQTKGTLFKNLPYEMVYTNVQKNGKTLKAIEVNFTLPNGNIVQLRGLPRDDNKVADSDGFVDLLIDLDNPNNYYLDFEITKK